MSEGNLVDQLEAFAKSRREPTIPRDYLVEVVEMIESGQVPVQGHYPTGERSLGVMYEFALFVYENRDKIF